MVVSFFVCLFLVLHYASVRNVRAYCVGYMYVQAKWATLLRQSSIKCTSFWSLQSKVI